LNHVRFTPESGRQSDIVPCPLSAKSRNCSSSARSRLGIERSRLRGETFQVGAPREGKVALGGGVNEGTPGVPETSVFSSHKSVVYKVLMLNRI